MRLISLGFAAAAAVGVVFVYANNANALTAPPPAGVQLAVEEMQGFETVHCRRFRHRHRYGHGWSRGCRDGVVIIVPGERRRGFRERTRIRGPVGIETRTRVKTETKGPDTTVKAKSGVETKSTPAKGGIETKGAPTKTGVETKKSTPAPAQK